MLEISIIIIRFGNQVYNCNDTTYYRLNDEVWSIYLQMHMAKIEYL